MKTKMNKLLAAALSLTVFASSVTAYASDRTISLSNVSAESGETARMTVTMSGNPGIWGADITVSYDNSHISLIDVENGEVFAATELTKGNFDSANYILSYEGNNISDTSANGVLATLVFDIPEGTPDGTYPVTLSSRKGDIVNTDEENVEFTFVSGTITVGETEPEIDVNEDGKLDGYDVNYFITVYASDSVPSGTSMDVDADGTVTLHDLNLLMSYIRSIMD